MSFFSTQSTNKHLQDSLGTSFFQLVIPECRYGHRWLLACAIEHSSISVRT